MAQHGFGQMGAGNNGIDPNDLLGGSFNPSSFQNNFGSAQNNHSSAFSSGSALISDDDLFDTLGGPADNQNNLHPASHDFSGMSSIPIGGGYSQGMFAPQHGLSLDQSHINGYSNTPEGDPIQSPFVNSSMSHYRSIQPPQAFGSLQSPNGAYTGSPLAASEFTNDASDATYLKSRSRMSQSMPRKTPTARSPLTAKVSSSIVTAIPAPSSDSFAGSSQPIRTNGSNHEKSNSGQWAQTPNSLSSFPGSGFSSPMQPGGLHSAQINEMLLKGGTSMPAKLGGPMTTSQEAKRKRRRESHNLVERRRRDNINERIQDLSKLVPSHRLDDERIKKIVTSGTPLSPSLVGISSPPQATSGLAGPGARRATNTTAGNITTGLPLEEKDKGPNKGDILNGAVSWCRDLMWLLDKYVSRQEELIEFFNDRGETMPFSITDDERRMTSELMVAMRNPDGAEGDKKHFTYSRTDGSGLRVPDYTDYKGDSLNGSRQMESLSLLDDASGIIPHDLNQADFWAEDDGGDMELKEEDEFMDLS
ncbi:helix-loop-helix dna-binding domain-containing protein [Ophiostoma piceae UAMH 11346]|uniref:Helix-loop-helix dna-binding domain-containing protein n=1 Tax=Ophiostoma piceae (strain UAMH 11346) TaxID=1262450 RepID=S3D728_OPHP1|nr:helix-loop-helix dna-binding domain-containing protein [Ophiostoma piceae UAMH 11346]